MSTFISVVFLGMFAACSPEGLDTASTDEPVSYEATVWPILEANCASCHAGGYQPNLVLTDASTAYTSLLEGAPVSTESFEQYVVPGDVAGSLLVDKIEADPTYGGLQMPVTGTYPDQVAAPMAEADIAVVEEWIRLGAPPE